jgi:hypothetical protein
MRSLTFLHENRTCGSENLTLSAKRLLQQYPLKSGHRKKVKPCYLQTDLSSTNPRFSPEGVLALKTNQCRLPRPCPSVVRTLLARFDASIYFLRPSCFSEAQGPTTSATSPSFGSIVATCGAYRAPRSCGNLVGSKAGTSRLSSLAGV